MGHTIKGEVASLLTIEDATFTRNRDGFQTTIDRLGVLVDADGNSSLPLRLPEFESDRAIDFLAGRIDDCEGPETEKRGLLRKKFVTGCPALGSLGIRNPQFNNAILEEISPQVLKVAYDAKRC